MWSWTNLPLEYGRQTVFTVVLIKVVNWEHDWFYIWEEKYDHEFCRLTSCISLHFTVSYRLYFSTMWSYFLYLRTVKLCFHYTITIPCIHVIFFFILLYYYVYLALFIINTFTIVQNFVTHANITVTISTSFSSTAASTTTITITGTTTTTTASS